MSHPLRAFLLGPILAFLSATGSAAPEWYVNEGDWHPSFRASLAALIDHERAEREAAGNETTEHGVELGPWWAIGSFSNAGGEGFAYAYPPELGIDLKARYDGMQESEATWRRMDFEDGSVIDLLPHFAITEAAIAYLYRTLTAPEACEITGYFGSDDGLAVWLNGELLLSQDVPRGPGPDQAQAPLKLRAGENHLLLKIVNRTGGWAYYFHTRPGGGAERDGLRSQRIAAIWSQLRQDFAGPTDQWEMACEQRDGIHSADASPDDVAGLKRRYEAAAAPHRARCERLLDGLATDLGEGACKTEAQRLAAVDEALARAREAGGDEAGMADARSAYYDTLRAEQALSLASRLVNLGLAIDDLAGSFPDAYVRADEYRGRSAGLRAELDRADGLALDGLEQRITRLQVEALVNDSPLLRGEKLLYITRKPGGGFPGLPQNWQGNSSVQRTGWDTTISLLPQVTSEAESMALFHSPDAFVGDMSLSFDAQRMLFSMPDPQNAMTYQVWEIGVNGTGLRLVTQGSDPDYDNYDPCYLPDGDIMFVSTRCYQAVPCTGGDHVGLLYRSDPEGRHVRQLTFDQDHSWNPTVLNDGRIVYTRWEYNDTPHYFSRILFAMDPDGTGQMALYGSGSYFPNTTMYATPIPGDDSRVAAILSGHHGNPRSGEVAVLDLSAGAQHAEGVVQILPERHRLVEPVIVDEYATGKWPQLVHPYPLSGKYFLVSCKMDPSSPWGIYLVDVFDNLVPIRLEADAALFEPTLVRPRPTPPVIAPKVDYARDDALVYLYDVYRGPGLAGVPRGTVKRLRLVEPIYRYWGNGETYSCSIDGTWDVKRILGTVPVEEDGSALFRVPANTPIIVQPIDERNMAHQQMRSWLTAMPGEFVSCVGCHEPRRAVPPAEGLSSALTREPSEIKTWYGPARGFSFNAEVQPVLDKHCISCHSDAPIELRGPEARGEDPRDFSVAYQALHPYVRRAGLEADIRMLPPQEFLATTSPLVQMLDKGHFGVELSTEEWDRLITWIDLNVPYAGDWSQTRQAPPAHLVERREELRDEDRRVRAELARKPVVAEVGR